MCDGLKCCGGQIWRTCQCGTSILERQVYPALSSPIQGSSLGKLWVNIEQLPTWYALISFGKLIYFRKLRKEHSRCVQCVPHEFHRRCLIHGGRCPKRYQGHPQAEDISWKSLDPKSQRDKLRQSLKTTYPLHIFTCFTLWPFWPPSFKHISNMMWAHGCPNQTLITLELTSTFVWTGEKFKL